MELEIVEVIMAWIDSSIEYTGHGLTGIGIIGIGIACVGIGVFSTLPLPKAKSSF